MKIPVIKNTVTNYLNAGVRLLQGILISRWIIGYLGMEYYGLWTLLWSFFVYALLLDFGTELAGGAAIVTRTGGRCRLRFGESASEAMGTPVWRILLFHLLPNVSAPI